MRKLLMLVAMALAAVAFAGVSASAASANRPFEIYTSDTYENLCPEVSLVNNEVSGGCLTEDFEGTIEFYQHWTGSDVLLGVYDVTFDLVLDSDGDGYIVDADMEMTYGSFPRDACDEFDGTVIPWPVDMTQPVDDDFWLDITLGIRSTVSGPGGVCANQGITLESSSLLYGSSVFDQVVPSANFRDGHFESANDVYVIPTY